MKNIKSLFLGIVVAIFMFAPVVLAQTLEEGEILYQGVVKLEKCDEAIVSFVLNAQKDTIKNFSFELNGIYVRTISGTMTKRTTKNTYGATAAVSGGTVDYTYPWRGENWRIKIKQGLGTDTVMGEVKCVYAVSSDQIENLGTAPIVFKKVEAKQD
jgi:hypothetical protein